MTDLTYLSEDNDPNRFDLIPGEPTMKAVVTTGNGGYEKLDYRDVPMPKTGSGEVLVKVLAAGVNNTEINTRLGWYSSSVKTGTETFSDSGNQDEVGDGGWNGKTPFPFIQGTDCCGQVVEIATDAKTAAKVGDRVLIRCCMRLTSFDSPRNIWMASDFDGAFAQYVTVPASEVFTVNCNWSDVELATVPCAYGTAENLVHRTAVSASDRVLITGASGGVGSAAVQLCKRRGAHVTAVTSKSKMENVKSLGTDVVLTRDVDLIEELGESSMDVVIDIVAGEGFSKLPKIMARGGRYASSGAIAGPMVSFDMRDFYLKDLTLYGGTGWDEPIFPNVVGYIERGEIRPLLDKTFELKDIAKAQQEFMKKKHFGNYVLIPPKE